VSDASGSIRLRSVKAKCTLCDWKVAQIDTNPERAHQIVEDACNRHFDEQHAASAMADVEAKNVEPQ
jgi:hypothetical protein